MPRLATIYGVLIASPTEMTAERQIIRDCIHRWNARNSRAAGLYVEPVMWETHAVPEYGAHPQKLINKQIVEWCDILIACFWSTPGSETDTAESGTIEEIEEFIRTGRHVMIYFCTRDLPQSHDRAAWERLKTFKDKCRTEGLYCEFSDNGDLSQKVDSHLALRLNRVAQDPNVGLFNRDGNRAASGAPRGRGEVHENWMARLGEVTRAFRYNWQRQIDSPEPDFDSCKLAAETLASDLVSLLSELDEAAAPDLAKRLESAMRTATELAKHQFYMDAGASYKRFEGIGGQLLATIQALTER